MTKRSSHF